MRVSHLNDIGLDAIVSERLGPTLVAFLSHESVACDHFRPELGAAAAALDARAVAAWIDADENPAAAQKWGVIRVPTTFIFRAGGVVDRLEGPLSRETLVARVTSIL